MNPIPPPVETWLSQHGHNPRAEPFAIGCRVTGVPGRISHGWTGIITSLGTYKTGIVYYEVLWLEREYHESALVRKEPILSMLRDQIQVYANEEPTDGF
jgi:hypothetical protein